MVIAFFESISCFINDWWGKPFELWLKSITWAQKQVSQGTSWGMSMWMKFDKTKVNIDCYNKKRLHGILGIHEDSHSFWY